MSEARDQNGLVSWFQGLEPVNPLDLVGLWKGTDIPSGHPLDGVLGNLGWFGKRFHPDLRADALLFQWRPGRLVPIEAALFPIKFVLWAAPFGRTSVARGLSSYLQKMFRARGQTACLKLLQFKGGLTAAMVYDEQPVTDYIRRISADTVAGMMCVDGDPRRFFFKLERVRDLMSPDTPLAAGRAVRSNNRTSTRSGQ